MADAFRSSQSYILVIAIFILSMQLIGCGENVPDIQDEAYDEPVETIADEETIVEVGSKERQKPAITIQEGHASSIEALVFSVDGQILASASQKVIKIQDASNGRIIREIHSDSVKAVAISPDNHYLAATSGLYTTNVWSLEDGSLINQFKSRFISHIAFSPNEPNILAFTDRNNIAFGDVKTKRIVNVLKGGVDSAILSLDFSDTGNEIVAGYGDGSIHSWNINTREIIQSLPAQEGNGVGTIDISPDGNWLLSSIDTTLYLWDLSIGKLIQRYEGRTGYFFSPQFTSDSKTIVSLNKDHSTVLWEMGSSDLSILTSTHKDNQFTYSALSQGGNRFAVVDTKGKIYCIDLTTNKVEWTFKEQISGFDFALGADNNKAVIASGKTLQLWGMRKGTPIKEKVVKSRVGGIYLGGGGQVLFLKQVKVNGGKHKNIVHQWDSKSGVVISTGQESSFYDQVGVSPDGNSFAIVANKKITIWNTNYKKTVQRINNDSVVTSIRYSREGLVVTIDKNGKQKYWDDSSGELIKERIVDPKALVNKNESIGATVFSPDESSIIIGTFGIFASNRILKVDIDTQQVVWSHEVEFSFGFGSSMTFSPDGEQIAFSVAGNTLLIEAESGRVTSNIKNGTATYAPNATYSKNSQELFISRSNLRNYSTETGKELYRIVPFEESEWVSVTNQGFFNASKHGAKKLNIRTAPLKVTSIDAFYEKFYRPDIVKLAIAGEAIDTEINISDMTTPPKVEFINTVSNTTNSKLDLNLKITDMGGGIGEVRIYRNGTAIKIDGERGLSRIKESHKSEVKTYSISLENGENILTASAFDSKNIGRSEFAKLVINAKLSKSKPKLHAVVVGIEDYRNSKLNLNFAVDDAQLFADSLKEYSSALFDEINIHLLTTKEQTTKSAIEQYLKKMQTLAPEDLFVFYVASHGTVDNGDYYLVTSNVGSTSTRKLKQDALTQDNLKDLLANIPTAKKMIVLDTCNSQAMGDSLQVALLTRGLSEDTAMKVLSRAIGSTILTASTSTQEALEGYKGHGLFTYVLSEGLKGKADTNNDGFVKTSELADYIEDEVPVLAEKAFGREQFPSPARNGQSYPITTVK